MFRFLPFIFGVLLFIFGHTSSMAADGAPSPSLANIPEHTLHSAPETDLPIRLKLSKKPQFLHLNADVRDVTVDEDGKPAHISAVRYDSRSIALLGRSKGAAHITVFGKNGAPIMSRYVIVADPTDKYIRMHLTCKKGDPTPCDKTRIYFCPNFCYETQVIRTTSNQPLSAH